MPEYRALDGTVYKYISLPDLFSGGTSFIFDFHEPYQCEVIVAIADSLIQYVFPEKPRFPETIAYRLFPAFKKHLENRLREGGMTRWLSATQRKQRPLELFTEANYEQLRTLMENDDTSPEEKLKIYWMISAHNVFSDGAVPMSIRLLADETGISQEQIKTIVHNNPSDFRIASNDFLFLEGHYEL